MRRLAEFCTSLPARERGLKYDIALIAVDLPHVAPRAGAWIEILVQHRNRPTETVAPRAGAWIEIRNTSNRGPSIGSLPARERGLKSFGGGQSGNLLMSLPARERGLKSVHRVRQLRLIHVAPRAGAWIEIWKSVRRAVCEIRRSPRGSVD